MQDENARYKSDELVREMHKRNVERMERESGVPVGFYLDRRGRLKPVAARQPAKGGRNFRYR